MSSQSKSEDRLSSLPKELLSHILSSMPTKFAVRTSVLSKRWRYNWTLTTNLDFDDDPPVHAVNRVLNLCKTSKIKRFRLHFSPRGMQTTSELKSNISNWINKAVRLNVCEIDLKVTPFELPLSLFTCKTLTKLSLAGWGMEGFVGPTVDVDVITLPLLKTLHITLPMLPGIAPSDTFKLIYACPNLEDLSLAITFCNELQDYSFNIPSLKRLKLQIVSYISPNKVILNLPNLEHLSVVGLLSSLFVVQDLSSLIEANVDLSVIKTDLYFLYGELLKGISGAKSISWSSPYLDVLFLWTLPKFPNLKHMDLDGSLDSPSLKKLFLHLGRSSNLEHLCFQEPEECWWIDPRSAPSWMLMKLKTMEITRCKGRECDIQFIEYVLGNLEVLKKLTVTCESLSMEDEKQVCARLLKCTRASKVCEIHFVGKWLLNIF